MFERKVGLSVVLVALLALGAWGCAPNAVGDELQGEGLTLKVDRPGVSLSKADYQRDICEDIQDKYSNITEQAGVCRADEDCQMLQGQCGVGIGGCYEFVNHSVDQDDLDELGRSYSEAGCTGAVCSCLPPHFDVYCDAGQCVGEFEGFEPTCADLADEDFGACAMVLGWGVVNGTCQTVSGCDAGYRNFFESVEECEAACLDNNHSDRCDDGSMLMCLMPIPPCGPGEIPAIKNGCYECVNEITCEPWGVPGCHVDDDCQAGQLCDDCATSSCYVCDDCVAGCVDEPIGHECDVDADCELYSDYCGGCYCLALGFGDEAPTCDPDEMVHCIVDPCMLKEARCAQGACRVIDSHPAPTPGARS